MYVGVVQAIDDDVMYDVVGVVYRLTTCALG